MGKKILIVDDEVHIRTLLEQALEEAEAVLKPDRDAGTSPTPAPSRGR